jgi:hypothetical protein
MSSLNPRLLPKEKEKRSPRSHCADGGDGEAQVGGDLFQGNPPFAPPLPEGAGKVPANLTFESRSLKHGGISPQNSTGAKKQLDPV